MEALRYLPYLSNEGWVVSSSHPFKNIPNYPDEATLMAELKALPHVATLPIEEVAREHSLPKSANMVLLGMSARYMEILTPEQLRQSIARVFAAKGDKVVNDNLKAFDLGLTYETL